MKNKIVKKKNYYYLPFFIVTFAYTLFLLKTPIIADDLALIDKYVGITWLQEWNNILFDYFNWSSRVIVNATIHIFLGHRKIYWSLATGILILLLLMALDKIFNPEKDRKKNNVIILVFTIFPFYLLAGSGWRVGTISYFWSIAFAVIGIVPLAMMLRKEKVSIPLLIFSSFSLIFAGNFEECLIVLLVIYGTFFVYFCIKKKIQWAFLLQCFILLGSFIFVLTTPGNKVRAGVESSVRFKDFGMLNIFDKFDLGFSSTMQELMFTENTIFLILSILLTVYVFNNYKSNYYRGIGMIPLSVAIIAGYSQSWLMVEYSNIANLIEKMPVNGMITVDNYLSLFPYVKIIIFLMTAIAIIIDLYLVFGNTYKTILAEALLFGGTASRMVLGFSPSIWVSGARTYVFLYFCLIIISLMIINQIKIDNIKKSWYWPAIYYMLVIFGTLSFLNLLTSV